MNIAAAIFHWFADPAHWTGQAGVPNRLAEHVLLTVVSVAIACAIALPVALWLGHLRRGGALAINVSNVGRAVPIFAVLVLLAITSLGFGVRPTIIALVLFGIPPALTNAYVGMQTVDRGVVEAARGMGMTGWQLLRRVELPLAAPLILNGVRLCAVQIVATATVAALVAGPGLGRIITAGFGRQDEAEVASGGILVALLALVVEGAFALLQRRVDPMYRVRRERVPGSVAAVERAT